MSRPALVATVLLVSAAGALAFHNAVHDGATNYDDIWVVTANPLVKAPATLDSVKGVLSAYFDSVTGILFAPYHSEYQPVKYLSYLADDTVWRALGVNAVFGMHLTNVIFHLLNSILVVLICFAVVRDLAPGGHEGPMALAVGLFSGVYFVLHPAHVESVAWLSSRKDVLSLFFMALSFLAFRGFVLEGGARRAVAAVVLFALALGAKALVAFFPLVAVTYWWLTGWKGGLKVVPTVLALFALSCLFAALAGWLYAASGYLGWPAGGSAYLQFLTAIKTFPFYMRLLLFPVNLNAIYALPAATGALDPAVWWGASMILAQLAVAVFVPSRPAKFIVIWYMLALVPVLQFVRTGAIPSLAADRYAYYASVPFALAPALIVWRVRSALVSRGAVGAASILLAAAVLYAGVLGVATWSRNRVWRSSETLWRDVLAKNKASSIALVNLGQTYAAEGNDTAARRLFRQALRGNPGFLVAVNNLADTYQRAGDAATAKALYKEILMQPSSLTLADTVIQCARAELALARIYYSENRYLTARRYADAAERTCESMEGVAGMLLAADRAVKDSRAVADELIKAGDDAASTDAGKAALQYYHAADAAIEYAAPHVSLARLYAGSNEWDKALDEFNAAAKLGATGAQFDYDFGVAALKNGDYSGGAELLSRALALDPTMDKAKVKLAIAHAYMGEPAQALLLLKDVLDRDPSNAEARANWKPIKDAVEKNAKAIERAHK